LEKALSGLRVVDFSQYIAGPTVSMLLADLGARVIRVDPPGGPRWSDHANAALHRGKESIVLDLHDEGDLGIAQQLTAGADIVLESFRPGVMGKFGLDAQSILATNPAAVVCSIPGFAASDPRSQLPAWEGVVAAAAGLYIYPGSTPMNYTGDRTKDPYFTAIPQASSFAAAVAAHSIMAALVARQRFGIGQAVEVPLFDATFELIGASMQRNPDAPPRRDGPPPPNFSMVPQIGRHRCADGKWIELCLFQDKHLRWFADAFMPQEWIDDGMADGQRMWTDPELQAIANPRFAELMLTRTALEWEIAINDVSGASAALCSTTEYWLREDSHARSAGAVIELDDPELGPTAQLGYPVTLSQTPLVAAGPRHALDADRERIIAELESGEWVPSRPVAHKTGDPRGALDDISVLDVSQVLAGPTTTRILAEYGASVIKIHSFEDRQLGMHLYTNSGKQSIMLNLKTEKGAEIFAELAAGVDVFVQNFARGVAERIGVGYDDLRALSPEVVYASISAFGYEGYRGAWRGREQLGQGVTGMQRRLGGDGAPVMAPHAYCDYMTGNWAAFGVLVGLFHRLRGGGGQVIGASLSSSATFLQAPFMVAYEGKVWDEPATLDAKGWSALDRLYRTADRWVYLAAPTPAAVAELCAIPDFEGINTLLARGASDDELAEFLSSRILRKGASHWTAFTGHSLGIELMADLEEAMESPLSKERGVSILRDHPVVGRMRMAGPSARLSVTPPRLTRPVGPPGSDTRAVIASLGREAEFDELLASGVVLEGLPYDAQMVGLFR
jgi:crotonobetainyl-CoA:carnitine CoA-transferase CaiB-like acyl-CoA transferase